MINIAVNKYQSATCISRAFSVVPFVTEGKLQRVLLSFQSKLIQSQTNKVDLENALEQWYKDKRDATDIDLHQFTNEWNAIFQMLSDKFPEGNAKKPPFIIRFMNEVKNIIHKFDKN